MRWNILSASLINSHPSVKPKKSGGNWMGGMLHQCSGKTSNQSVVIWWFRQPETPKISRFLTFMDQHRGEVWVQEYQKDGTPILVMFSSCLLPGIRNIDDLSDPVWIMLEPSPMLGVLKDQSRQIKSNQEKSREKSGLSWFNLGF